MMLCVAERDTKAVGIERAGMDEVRTMDLMLGEFYILGRHLQFSELGWFWGKDEWF